MILHPDGRVEGTPEEVVAYKREIAQKLDWDPDVFKPQMIELYARTDEDQLGRIKAAIQAYKDRGLIVPITLAAEAMHLEHRISMQRKY